MSGRGLCPHARSRKLVAAAETGVKGRPPLGRAQPDIQRRRRDVVVTLVFQ